MRRRLKEPFGKAGLTVAIVALVLAMVGGAYAAGGLTKSQEKQVTKIAKEFAGKPGSAGPAGQVGAAGSPGAPGKEGSAGKNGTDVTFSPASEAACPSGGSVFKAANGETTICNGTTGFTKTLPKGETEEGAWGAVMGPPVSGAGPSVGQAPISFPIPLASAPKLVFVHPEVCELKPEPQKAECEAEQLEQEEECPGSAAAPVAEEGALCVYTELNSNPAFVEFAKGSTPAPQGFGTTLAFFNENQGSIAQGNFVRGSWAVTAS